MGPIRLLVLQWAHDRGALQAVEDELTPLARSHGATVTRDRAVRFGEYGTDAAPPDEVHLVTFPDEAALQAYLDDPARPALRERLVAALSRTEVWRLDDME